MFIEVKKKSELINGLRDSHPARVLSAALTYFGVVFGIAFMLGLIRMVWIVPILGLRNAELIEHPLMLVVIFLAARWTVRRICAQITRLEIVSVGLIAFGMLILTEVMVALFIQPKRPSDTLSAIVYFAMLGIFALMPMLVAISRLGKSTGSPKH